MRATNEIDLNLVAIFTRVVEEGSFTAAAETLRLPKSSVSRAVSRLEEALGVRLLQRTTRKLALSQAGERYLAEVRGPMARVAEASSEISEMGSAPRGVVRMSIAPPVGDSMFADLFVEFARAHPGIRVELVVVSRRVNLVEEGIDMALRSGKLDDSTLVARKVAVVRLGLYAAPSYLARRPAPRRFSELALHDAVVFKSATGILPWRLSGPRGVEHVEVTGRVIADDLATVRLLTVSGLGIALMPDAAVWTDVERGALVRVLPSYAHGSAALHLVSVPLRHVPLRVKLLRDFLLREIPRRLAGTPCAVETTRAARAPARAGASENGNAARR
jgi:DNA-binding transcriptional LysR family regulator